MSLLEILNKTELRKDGKTNSILSKAIRKAFDETKDREEAETLILLAHKYSLPCLDDMLNDLEYVPELPF